ncbi:MAG TPA: hypothetical protein GXX40_00650 [Firmicutes bacterium]|nr:hypothetical protein [Bacillota bacterium]
MVAGCWDRKEIEDRSTVIALGIDRAESQPLRVVAFVVVPRRPEGGSSGRSSRLVTASASTFAAALDQVQREVKGPLALGQIRLILLGRRLGATELGLAVRGLGRYPSIRLDALVAAVDAELEEVFSLSPGEEELLPLHAAKLLASEISLGNVPQSSLGKFIADHLDVGIAPVVPRFVVKDGSLGVDGMVVYPLQGAPTTLSTEQTKAYLLATGQRARVITFMTGGNGTVAKLVKNNSRINVSKHENGYLTAQVACHVEADLVEGELLSEEDGARQLEDQIREVIKSAQAAGADIIGLGRYALPLFPSRDKAEANSLFSSARVEVRVNYIWRRKGS